ncbi:MAG TPA: cyclopropane-fatty-acyl-phospholipid synthase family protein [Nakamurella sp.]|nr:cyclopropane-fatty-acyl-phospholipid synthase family protein [Nakamurella sp.]
MSVATLLRRLLGDDVPVRFEAYDGSFLGPPGARTLLRVHSADAIRRLLTAPGELGIARAYVAGDLDIERGTVFDVLELRHARPDLRVRLRDLLVAARLLGLQRPEAWRRLRPAPPPEEARLRGRRHTKGRDAVAVTHHYDVSNAFYELVLGPSMTYSCAVWEHADLTLEQAQTAKYELVARKLALRPGMRLLDVGCGWGGMALHAAARHGVQVVGITLSQPQASYATQAARRAGVDGRVTFRVQDYRDVTDGPFDAISSIGMVEHVGDSRLPGYADHLFDQLRPGGRLLNHGIGSPSDPVFLPNPFVARYVFPDGELPEVGRVVSVLQRRGFEVRHQEGLREHYALTLRAWVRNLEDRWDDAVREVGANRARVWRLYMAGAAVGFEEGSLQIHQVLAVRPSADGTSGFPLRPDWEQAALVPEVIATR